MTQINTYIGFNGKCKEAMTFYRSCLGGELFIQTVGETPMQHQCPDGMQDHVMHSMLEKDGLILMGTDMVGKQGYQPGNNIALSLNCSSELEIKTFFSKLSEDGEVIEPLTDMFWGATFGALTDKFGISWMFNYDKKTQG
jgi:PhnB protein